MAKPFVKWAGGKGNLVKQLEGLLPGDFNSQKEVTYIEPFVGGGAMLFYMLQKYKNITKAVINDINADLIRCYQLVKDNPYALLERLHVLENNYFHYGITDRRELYYAYRDQFNLEGINVDERAALFIFLNHTCFNGLFRVNSQGKFNVPYGRYKHPVICNEKVIMDDHRLLNSLDVVIRQPGDYKLVSRHLSVIHPNFLYFDPPYRPLLNETNFKQYSNSPFGDQQQEELKSFCDALSNRGCQIMVSNSDSKNPDGGSYFEELYLGYRLHRIIAPRFINASPDKRVKLTEVVLTNYN